jgi:hypothetical protein
MSKLGKPCDRFIALYSLAIADITAKIDVGTSGSFEGITGRCSGIGRRFIYKYLKVGIILALVIKKTC